MANLCNPSVLNPHWADARNQVHLASSVIMDLFWSEVHGETKPVVIPQEIEHIWPDLVLAARTCAAAWGNRGMTQEKKEKSLD